MDLEEYQKIVGTEKIDQLHQLANSLKGAKIVHVNSTRIGGGVAEILEKLVPLTNHLGIETSWEVISGTLEFYQCTKNLHNALQGNRVVGLESQLKQFEEVNAANAAVLQKKLQEATFVFIHDPQPLPLIIHFPQRKGKWIWRCHIDASKPYRPIWKYLSTYISKYDACIFSLVDFAQPLAIPMYLIPPSIDPLSEKNCPLEQAEIDKVYELFNLDPERPMILQVSRFDHFKDPVGVIEAYRLAKKFSPDLQLVLAGAEASDDPEGSAVLEAVKVAAGEDKNIRILLLPANAHRAINALQRAADIVLQKSIKEGFGLTVTEALWKGKPVIGGNTGGIRLQVIDYKTGFLVNTPEGAAHRIRYLLQNKDIIESMSSQSQTFIRDNFLITRQLRDYLTLIASLYFDCEDHIELGKISKS